MTEPARWQGEPETPLLQRILAAIRADIVSDYRFVAPRPIPWTELRAPPSETKIVLVTTGGLHRRDDRPFEALQRRLGDTSFRLVPHRARPEDLDLRAPYVDPKYTPRDPEVALPMAALERCCRARAAGGWSPEHVSFCGGVVEPFPGLAESVDALAPRLLEHGVGAAILLPTCSLCIQTTCVIAQQLEARGLATVSLSLIPELSAIVGAPRTLTVPFPFGAPCGDPGHGALHDAVLGEALTLLAEAQAPGEMRTSRQAWRRDVADVGDAAGSG